MSPFGRFTAYLRPYRGRMAAAVLLIMMVAFTLLFFTLHLAAMRNEIMRRRVRTLMIMQAQAAAGA